MTFQIEFETDNAAFGDYPVPEITQILDGVKSKILNGETEGRLRDTNGNTVGQWYWEEGR